MSTIDSKSIIDRIIANDGYYDVDDPSPDNPRALEIVEYENAYGRTTWGVGWETDPDPHRYQRASPYVQRPRVIWAAT